MASVLLAFEHMIRNEGGCVLHQMPIDQGGMTYAGIAYPLLTWAWMQSAGWVALGLQRCRCWTWRRSWCC